MPIYGPYTRQHQNVAASKTKVTRIYDPNFAMALSHNRYTPERAILSDGEWALNIMQ
jgi:hypothetical protein